MASDVTSVPQSVVTGALAILSGVLGWAWNRNVKKTDEIGVKVDALVIETARIATEAATFATTEVVARDYVSRKEHSELELRVAGLASRRELLAYMRQHEEQQQRQHELQQRQHDENKTVMKEIRDLSERRDTHAQEFRKEMRENFSALALRVEKVATIQQVQGATKGS